MITFNTILLTTDFSAYADAAIPYAGELARDFRGQIRLLHVFDDTPLAAGFTGDVYVPFDWIDAARKERRARLSVLAEKISLDEKIEVQPCMREGNAKQGILDEAKECHADCIVIATHGRTGIPHFLFGSVAEQVVCLSTCPVMTVRPAATEVKTAAMEAAHAPAV